MLLPQRQLIMIKMRDNHIHLINYDLQMDFELPLHFKNHLSFIKECLLHQKNLQQRHLHKIILISFQMALNDYHLSLN